MILRILLVDFMDVLTPGGINTVVREVAKYLAKKGHEVYVFTQSAGRENLTLRYGNLTIIKGRRYTHLPYWFNVLNLKLLLKTIHKIKPHIIHVHGYQNPFPFFATLLIRIFYRYIPTILSPHFSIFGHSTIIGKHLFKIYNISLGRKFINVVDALVLSSNFEVKTLINEIGKIKPKIYIIPHGVSYSGNECHDYRATNKLFKKSNQIEMVYVGYLHEYKGVQDAIKALAELIYAYNVRIKLIVIGDGPYKKELMKLATSLKVEKYIEWVGFQRRRLLKYLCNADILVFPSKGEMFGLVAYEALKLGLPVIVKKKGALIECTRYNCCLGISTYSEITQLILNAKEAILSGHLKSLCKESAKNILSWEQIVIYYEKLYLEILKQQRDNIRV